MAVYGREKYKTLFAIVSTIGWGWDNLSKNVRIQPANRRVGLTVVVKEPVAAILTGYESFHG